MTSLRTKSAIEAKRQKGGFIGRAPEGYVSVEDVQPHRKGYAHRTHHIEIDPSSAPRDLLLEDQLTLTEIALELHTRGYRYRSGRPFWKSSAVVDVR